MSPVADASRLFAPRSVAVVGASPSAGKIGNVLVRNLAGFGGAIHPVHPTASEVLGRRAYPSVATIPEPVDLALLAIPAEAVPAAVEDCVRASVGGAVIFSGGWAETDVAGRTRQAAVAERAKAGGLRLLGPNTSGFVRPDLGLYATFVADLPSEVRAGGVAVVAQSGGVNLSLCFQLQNEGLGVRFGVGLGNAADVGWADTLEWLADDDGTDVVLLAMEGVADGRALVRVVERVAARRPVVALKVGRNDVSAFARSHTGNLTGSHRITRAALAQAGALVVDSVGELVDAARALSTARLPALDKVGEVGIGVVTGQAGPGLLLADALRTHGLAIPPLPEPTKAQLARLLPPLTYQENPVDTGRPSPTFPEVLRTVRAAPAIDLLVVSLLHEPDAVDPAAALAAVAPAILCGQGPAAALDELRPRLAARGIALYPTPERAAFAASVLARDAHRRRQQSLYPKWDAPESSLNPNWDAPALAPFSPSTGWDEASAKQLLDALGIRTSERVVCADRSEAHAALARFGGPLVVKVLRADIAHKSEVGGVHLNVRTASELDRALDVIDGIGEGGATTTSDLRTRYLIERMAPDGPELLVGARRDPAFGPIVLLGAGGIGAELEDDVAVRLAPTTLDETAAMLGELASAWRYRGARGGVAVDEEELARLLASVAAFLDGHAEIAELEINPLRVTAEGLLALDALVVGEAAP